LFLIFWTLSGISLANRSRPGPKSVHVHSSRVDNVQKILGAIGYVGAKWGLGRVPDAGVFCQQHEITFPQLCNGRFSPNLAITRESWLKHRFWTEIYEKFPFSGHLPPKPQTWRGSNRHLTQSRLQVTGCTAERYRLLRVVDQGLGSFRARVNFLYDIRLRSYGASKLPNFRRQNCPIFGFWPIFPIQKPKKVPSGDQPTAQGLHRRMITIFPRGS